MKITKNNIDHIDYDDLINQLSMVGVTKPKYKTNKPTVIEIKLKHDEYLSNTKLTVINNGIPKLVQMWAGTGTGKTTRMMTNDPRDLVVISQKSILQQIELKYDWQQNGTDHATPMQFEHFANSSIDDLKHFNKIHIDEATIFTDSMYRSTAVWEVFQKVLELRKTKTVCLYSGTFDHNFNPFEYDYIVKVSKPIETQPVDVYYVKGSMKLSEDGTMQPELNRVTPRLMTSVIMQDLSKVVLVQCNSRKDRKKIAANLNKAGVTNVSCESRTIKGINHGFRKLAESGLIKDMGVQVVLTTSCMREGLDINDEVRIVTECQSPEQMKQMFARGRNLELCTYAIVMGNGQQTIDVEALALYRCEPYMCRAEHHALDNVSFDQARADHGITLDADILLDRILKKKTIAHTMYNNYCIRPQFAFSTVNIFCQKYSFIPTYHAIDKDGALRDDQIADAIANISKTDVNLALKESLAAEQAVELYGGDLDDWEHNLNHAWNYKKQFQNTIAYEYGEFDWLDAYSKFSNMTKMVVNRWDSKILDKMHSVLRDDIKPTIEKSDIQGVAASFWKQMYNEQSVWMEEQNISQRNKLYVNLVGYEYNKNTLKYALPVVNKWDVKLDSAQRSVLSKRKNLIEKDNRISVVRFMEDNNLSQLDLVEMKPKQIKLLMM
jgi:hypothetical protein